MKQGTPCEIQDQDQRNGIPYQLYGILQLPPWFKSSKVTQSFACTRGIKNASNTFFICAPSTQKPTTYKQLSRAEKYIGMVESLCSDSKQLTFVDCIVRCAWMLFKCFHESSQVVKKRKDVIAKKQIRRCNDFIKPTRRNQLFQLLVEANLPQCLTPNPVKNKSQECITQLLYWALGWHEQVNTMTNAAWNLKQKKKKTRI